MKIENILENKEILRKLGVDIFSIKRKYWFVRTQKGTYYEDFINDEFIGIEWDKVSNIDFIKNDNEDDLKEEILTQYPKVERPGYVAKQILKFCNSMKKGDIVLIPSEKSKWITFGEILDDNIYLYEEDDDYFQRILDDFFDDAEKKEEKTVLKKRRRVKWIKSVKKSELDPYLYSIIYSHNAVVEADAYSVFIDRMLSQFYIKGDEAYYTYKVNKKKNIPYKDMLKFLNNNNEIIEYIKIKYPELELNTDDFVIKINVQSKGPVQLKGMATGILIVGLGIGILCGCDMELNILGMDFKYKTEGLPKIISTVIDLKNKLDESKDEDLNKLKEELLKDKENLEIEVPGEKIENKKVLE